MASIREALVKAIMQGKAQAQLPTPDEEALSDPLIQPETYGAGGALKGLLGLGSAVPPHLLPFLGLMKKPQARAILPDGYAPVESFVPKEGVELLSGEQIMRRGKDPWLGYDRTFGTENGMLDYLPQGVRTQEQAARYIQAWLGRNALDPYAPLTDDGLEGTKRFWGSRD